MPKVSVNITCFNSEKFIRETLSSVLSQTYGDFEVIVMDDGSTDGTGSIVKSFSDARIKYFYKKNEGLAETRNKAFEASGGEYIAFLDHDDIWQPDNLQIKVDILRQNPDCSLVYSYPILIDFSGNILIPNSVFAEALHGRRGFFCFLDE